jgi:hypothetical protein
MSAELDGRAAGNLRRWQQSGEPLRWVESRQGRWGPDDLHALLEVLRRSEFWPLGPAAVEELLDHLTAEWWNLRHWQNSRQPWLWVEARQGQWHHGDWLFLVDTLGRSHFWPLPLDAVGAVLEQVKREYWNLRRWQESGQPRRWVESHRGRWTHEDWLALVEGLRRSDYWSLDLDMVVVLLEDLKAEWWNLHLWQQSGQARQWVEAQSGAWDHADWLSLLETLKHSEYWPLNPEAIGATLEETRRCWRNLRRWQQSSEPVRWVESHRGRWTPSEWQVLLEQLRQSEYGPLDPEAVRQVVEDARNEFRTLRCWERSGLARRWVEARQGRWGPVEWQGLLETLRHCGYWPVDVEALAEVLREVKTEWWNVQRWRNAGLARRWVESHRGQWTQDDWLSLLSGLQTSEFWPADPDAVRRVLDEVTTEWWNLRRWLETGDPLRLVTAARDAGERPDFHSLLQRLRQSEFWPLDPDAVRQVLEGLRTGEAHAA